jgi:tetratricopeptide (TPR) repeat protein
MEDPRRSADEELRQGRQALEDGDVWHAAAHVAGVLAVAPTLPEAHELLSSLAARTDGGLHLFPLDPHAFIGTVVARAHLLAAAGHPADGLALLAAASGHEPTVGWAGVPWVVDPGLGARVDPDTLARIAMQLCTAVADPAADDEREPLQPYLTLIRHVLAAHPQHSLLLGAGSALARRLGEARLAVAWARRGARIEPSKLAEIWLGYAYRSDGRIRESIAALRRAVDHDPDDLSVYADIAGTLADHGRLTEALRWTDRALERDPTFDCAVHTAHRLRYRADGDLIHLIALADFQRLHPDGTHQHTDLAECCAERPWLGRVPSAGDVVLDALRQVLASDLATGAQLRLSSLEAPSALRTLATVAPDLSVAVDDVPTPDIREPRRADGRTLWRYDGTSAAPALAPPSPAAAERLRELAHPVWPHPPAAYDAAIGLAAIGAGDLLALLVHPPAAPDTEVGRALAEHDPALWVRCTQVWACLGLLHHRTDEAWETSMRRRLLVELVWGIEDWVTEAALFALVTYAWVEPAVRAEVARLMAERLADVARVGAHRPVSIAWSVAQLALATPDLDASARELASAIIDGEELHPVVPQQRRAGRLRRWLRWR